MSENNYKVQDLINKEIEKKAYEIAHETFKSLNIPEEDFNLRDTFEIGDDYLFCQLSIDMYVSSEKFEKMIKYCGGKFGTGGYYYSEKADELGYLDVDVTFSFEQTILENKRFILDVYASMLKVKALFSDLI